MRILKWLIPLLALLGLLAWGFRPKPITVETGVVSRGPMSVTVDEDGKTRVRERYEITAPVAGRLRRIDLKAGAAVTNGQVLAVLEPSPSALLDPRSRATAAAREKAATAALEQARAGADKARADLDYAATQVTRAEALTQTGAATQDALDAARHGLAAAAAGQRAARFAAIAAGFDLVQARAALAVHLPGDGAATIELRSPVDGRILRVLQESETQVAPGQPLLTVGDPAGLEIEVDVLSSDAVGIAPGAPVLLEHWGGPAPLVARVRLVETGAFTKLSALGVEEQRVNVIADLEGDAPALQGLGDGYRVEARITTWASPGLLQIPLAALFRQKDDWAVFVAGPERAALRIVKIGHRNDRQAELLEGLAEGDVVVLHPTDRLVDGGRITTP